MRYRFLVDQATGLPLRTVFEMAPRGQVMWFNTGRIMFGSVNRGALEDVTTADFDTGAETALTEIREAKLNPASDDFAERLCELMDAVTA